MCFGVRSVQPKGVKKLSHRYWGQSQPAPFEQTFQNPKNLKNPKIVTPYFCPVPLNFY
ncbi:hypothetical protein GCM10028786_22940 [Flaviaesturariibacter terrae]